MVEMNELIRIKTISEYHDFLNLPAPTHPQISLIQQRKFKGKINTEAQYNVDLYQISLKRGSDCNIKFGRNTYDFDDGSMIFISPGQTFSARNTTVSPDANGWTLVFHPHLIKRSELGRKIDQYTFFNYEINEALHLSEKEIATVSDISEKIYAECTLNMDRHSQTLIRSNLEMLLNYCVRFYDRQFYTRTDLNADYVSRFMNLLEDYYKSDKPLDMGIPTVQYCGQEMGLSPYYLSDLLKRESGKNALEHIHLFLIEKAKALISSDDTSITQIAYDLGFEYPQHFSKLFKSKTGMSPRAFKVS